MAKKKKIERGSGNVFADLEYPDAEAHLLKAELVTRIDQIIRQRGLKQVEAAKLLGLSQPDVSRLLRGSFRELLRGAPPAPFDSTWAQRRNRHPRASSTATGPTQHQSITSPELSDESCPRPIHLRKQHLRPRLGGNRPLQERRASSSKTKPKCALGPPRPTRRCTAA